MDVRIEATSSVGEVESERDEPGGVEMIGLPPMHTGDLGDVDVLKEMARDIVNPALKYFDWALGDKRGDQLARMKIARIFNPLHAKQYTVSVADVDEFNRCFRMTRHFKLKPLLFKMKDELIKYMHLVSEIKDLVDRKDEDDRDTWDPAKWWSNAKTVIPSWATMCRAVLCHSPNSCPPERVFSILNDTFDDNMKRAYADYMELSLQLQFNYRDPIRGRKKETNERLLGDRRPHGHV